MAVFNSGGSRKDWSDVNTLRDYTPLRDYTSTTPHSRLELVNSRKKGRKKEKGGDKRDRKKRKNTDH